MSTTHLPEKTLRPIAEFSLPESKLVLGAEGNPPPWVEPCLSKLSELAALPKNWDSYGANPPDKSTLLSAWQLLEQALDFDSPPPALVPTSAGGVQIEWHQNQIDIEIEVGPPNDISIYFEDTRTGEIHEKDFNGDIEGLVGCVMEHTKSKLSVH